MKNLHVSTPNEVSKCTHPFENVEYLTLELGVKIRVIVHKEVFTVVVGVIIPCIGTHELHHSGIWVKEHFPLQRSRSSSISPMISYCKLCSKSIKEAEKLQNQNESRMDNICINIIT